MGHGEVVIELSGDANGDGSSLSGKNRGSFILVALTVVQCSLWNSLIRSGVCIPDTSSHELCEGE